MQLGQYFGSPNESNQQTLQAFCQLLDMRNMEFEKALRLLLSLFHLPGEAQQIDRIVKIFSTVYHSDNPNVFPDSETPYILAYSLIMLNTDAHSVKIQQKDKMTKPQFIKINKRAMPILATEKFEKMLEEIYDNIIKEKFQTKVDYIE